MFTWNDENNTKSVGYEKKNKTKQKNEEKEDTIPKASGWCRLLLDFLPGNNIRPESKEIKKVIII